MKILIFEWLSSGGLWHDRIHLPAGSTLQSQGMQMLQAITQDFLDSDVEIVLPVDGRWEDQIIDRQGLKKKVLWATDCLPSRLATLAEQVDHILLIAPESNSCLLACLDWLRKFEDKLISPGSEFVRIASNKQTTVDHLRSHGFGSVPDGMNLAEFRPEWQQDFGLPVVLKPVDGAGSEEVRQIGDWSALHQELSRSPVHYRLEKFIVGTPVSVSVLTGPGQPQFLPPTRQLFDQPPFGNYVGAGYPLEPNLARRATRLARRAIQSMPPTQGYVGIDMVLGERSEEDDCLIEINPRLTMSYLKLRQVCRENLAASMLAIALGTS